MQFGKFDDSSREYVITTPRTPHPWINYLGTEGFFSLLSNTAGGYSFYRDARLRRLTRYRYNDVPQDSNGRYLYIQERQPSSGKSLGKLKGEPWNPSWKPAKTELDFYECRHGLSRTTIIGEKNGLRATVRYMVPVGTNAELQELVLENTSREEKAVCIHSFVEFCLWNALDDFTNFQRNLSTGQVEVEGSAIYHVTEYRERRNHYAFFWTDAEIAGFDSDREAFIGRDGDFARPAAVLQGASWNSVADGWSPVASHRIEWTLEPGEKRRALFMLGYIENPQNAKWEKPGVVNKDLARKLQSRFSEPGAFQAAWDELTRFWDEKLSHFSISTGEEKLDRMANIWNQYQCVVTYNMARSASYFESGIGRGIGFRDTCQDMLGFVHLMPEKARERIFDVASTQFPDGGAYHQFQPLTKRGNADIGGNFNDDPLWLVIGVAGYLKETGDWDFLKVPVPFDNNPANTASLFEHLKRSFHHVTGNLGPHGLPLIGRADWNDCLNLNCFSTDPNDSFQTSTNKDGKTAESILIAQMFLYAAPDYIEICRRVGDTEEAKTAEKAAKAMEAAILAHGWDGQWFLRAYDDASYKVGSASCEDGKIYIETQGFGAMALIGQDRGYPKQALDSVAQHLDTPHGIVILDPPYKTYHLELGEVSSYPPGYKENGGIFCHNNPWVMIGEVRVGRPDRAFEYWKKIAPAYRETISELHRMEPYVYSQMIAGKGSRRHGEAKNSWLTGTAAWNFVALSQWILGIRPAFDGLVVEPRLPSHIKKAVIHRYFRGAHYEIEVENRTNDGPVKLTVNGKAQSGTLVPAAVPGTKVQIRATVG
ncbi:glycosyl transferase [Gracilinema caldarium]|uniref:GH36-type glycosyl hydrolase domain-containing protein n=1 Tax=Gracilinema caldarium TaxID=215591 RepID=UPI0026F09685|nr:glycosyl transferase [Gracilinema caldarium]